LPFSKTERELTTATSAMPGSATATVCKSVVVSKTTKVEVATSIWLAKRSELVTGAPGLRTGAAVRFCAMRFCARRVGAGRVGPFSSFSTRTAAFCIHEGSGFDSGGSASAGTSMTFFMLFNPAALGGAGNSAAISPSDGFRAQRSVGRLAALEAAVWAAFFAAEAPRRGIAGTAARGIKAARGAVADAEAEAEADGNLKATCGLKVAECAV
jgi:hypothetical protein